MKLLQILIAIDQLGNTLLGGMADETISARAHRGGHVYTEKLINWIFRNPNHCLESYLSEIKGSQNHPSYRNNQEQ